MGELFQAQLEREIEKRRPFVSSALWAALHRRDELRPLLEQQTDPRRARGCTHPKLPTGRCIYEYSKTEPCRTAPGIWWPQLAPLRPAERTELLKQLRHIWNLPRDPRLEADPGPPPKLDKPDLKHPN